MYLTYVEAFSLTLEQVDCTAPPSAFLKPYFVASLLRNLSTLNSPMILNLISFLIDTSKLIQGGRFQLQYVADFPVKGL